MARILRPVLIHEVFNRKSEPVIAMAITSKPQRVGLPLAFALHPAALPKPSWVKISQIRTLSMDRLGKRIGAVPPEALDRALEAVLELIG